MWPYPGSSEIASLAGMEPSISVCDIDELRAACAMGRRFEFLFFPDSGTVRDPPTESCLSQWGIAPFESGGHRFVSSEQAMMHGKAMLFGDREIADRILVAKTSFQAKELGAMVRGFDEVVWARERFGIVVDANLGKFALNPALRRFLLSTGDTVLAEASPADRIWGIGLDEFDRNAKSPDRWPGLNLLGFALMEVRRRLA